MRTPYDIYRPIRADDGEGGVLETYSDPSLIWGTISVYEGETQMHVDMREDVLVGDIVVVEEE